MKNLLTLNMCILRLIKGVTQLAPKAFFYFFRQIGNISVISIYVLLLFYLDNNDICNDGIKTLANANWEDLESINLGKNCITNSIIPTFQYAVWKDIVSLNICKLFTI